MFLADELVHVPIAYHLRFVKASHHGVAAAEGVVILAEDGGVQKAVLAENVHRVILHRGAGENQLVPGPVAQAVHGLALSGVEGLDALALIAYNEVGVKGLQALKDALSPCRFVVDHRHPQRRERPLFQVIQFLEALRFGTQQGAHGVGEVSILLELFGPHGAHTGGGHDEHPLQVAQLVAGSGHGDGGQGLAAAHLEQETESFALC